MKTKIHFYRFDTSIPAESRTYEAMLEQIKAQKGRGSWMPTWSVSNREYDRPKPGVYNITLETKFLFNNQWNSEEYGRVFDWYEIYPAKIDRKWKIGHWLEITEEMRTTRHETLKCGYTGEQYPSNCGKIFNESDSALGSPYLSEKELHLLRLLPVDTPENHRRPELTSEERAYLLPKYIEAQTRCNAVRNEERKKRQRQAAIDAYEEAVKGEEIFLVRSKARKEGLLWLVDHDISTENVIFYPHTGRFEFGWQHGLSQTIAAAMKELLKEFPFPYDITTEEDKKKS